MGVGLVAKHRRSMVAEQAAAGARGPGATSEIGMGDAGGIVEHDLVYPLEDHDLVYPDDPDPVPRS
jgi:hypothetical protein